MAARFLSTRFETDVELALAACAYYPDLEDAVAWLAERGKTTTATQLRKFRDVEYPDRYREIREQATADIEKAFAEDLVDGARLADLASTRMVERTLELLAAGQISDPSRAARDLQQVSAQKVEKYFALTGRPTQIIEHRSFEEISRSLVALGVAKWVDGTVEEDDDGADGHKTGAVADEHHNDP